jgi:FkbM family methyltransferase
LPPLDDRVLTPTVYGFTLCVSRRTGGNYYLQGFYELGTLAVMRRFLRPGDVFVDAGASVGLMSMLASRLVGDSGSVLAFEPQAARFADLTDSVAANGAGNVLCFAAGLGDEPSRVRLYSDRVSPSMVVEPGSDGAAAEVPVVRLDDVLHAHGLERVRMLKVDVEGYELKVLRGATQLLTGPEPPILCVEHGVYGEEPFLPLIEQLGGYQLFQLARGKGYEGELVRVRDSARLRRHDNVFCLPERVAEALGR